MRNHPKLPLSADADESPLELGAELFAGVDTAVGSADLLDLPADDLQTNFSSLNAPGVSDILDEDFMPESHLLSLLDEHLANMKKQGMKNAAFDFSLADLVPLGDALLTDFPPSQASGVEHSDAQREEMQVDDLGLEIMRSKEWQALFERDLSMPHTLDLWTMQVDSPEMLFRFNPHEKQDDSNVMTQPNLPNTANISATADIHESFVEQSQKSGSIKQPELQSDPVLAQPSSPVNFRMLATRVSIETGLPLSAKELRRLRNNQRSQRVRDKKKASRLEQAGELDAARSIAIELREEIVALKIQLGILLAPPPDSRFGLMSGKSKRSPKKPKLNIEYPAMATEYQKRKLKAEAEELNVLTELTKTVAENEGLAAERDRLRAQVPKPRISGLRL